MENISTIKSDILKEESFLYVLKNGLKVYFVPKLGFSKKYAIFSTNYGSNDNEFVPIGENEAIKVPEGIAHFLEHKLFEEQEGNIFDEFSKLGSYVNAFTNFNQTAYLFSCTDNFYKNLELLVSFVENPYFTDENVNKEKGIIAQEIKMYEDNPGWKVFFNSLKAMYHYHPVKEDIAGTVESITKIDKETLYKCYNTFYHPTNMILFLVGDIDFEKAIKTIEKNIKNKDLNTQNKIERIYPNEPKEIKNRYIEESLSVSIPLFNIGFKDKDVGFDGNELLEKEIVTNILLDMIFGESTELYKNMYEEGLVNNSFGAQFVASKTYSHSIIGGESSNPKKVLDKVIENINHLNEVGLNKEDFNRIKNKMIGHHIMSFDSLEYIANSFTKYEFQNSSLFDYINILKSINFQDIEKRFKSHFTVDNYILSVINPK
ncbi:EF-P 5-aminopentanol modification-associated protein YfmH [Senegalia massiliensis]|uniref:Insulinase family protein n=1 Tax=Senegalia massiliensis TaxID=1720316 RepID=A0A845QV43_9CLOT|nr:pitrilysin family protein [Senegalia massiliensis]NBI06767.1 insulinase family protein [Senegalia massiliensis]